MVILSNCGDHGKNHDNREGVINSGGKKAGLGPSRYLRVTSAGSGTDCCLF